MKDPVRDLPRVLNSSMSIAIMAFTLTVTALYIVLPMSTVREKEIPVVVRLTSEPSIFKHLLICPFQLIPDLWQDPLRSCWTHYLHHCHLPFCPRLHQF